MVAHNSRFAGAIAPSLTVPVIKNYNIAMPRKLFRRFTDAGLLEWPCASVIVEEDRGELEIRAIFSEIVGGRCQDLRLRFGRVVAIASFDEIAYPWGDEDVEVPRLPGDWRNYTYPILTIENSEWMALVGDALPEKPGALTHFWALVQFEP
jgi:hypothetical protein